MKTVYSIQDDIEYLNQRLKYLTLLLKVTNDKIQFATIELEARKCSAELFILSKKT